MLKEEKWRHYAGVFLRQEHLAEMSRRFVIPGTPCAMEPIEAGEDNLNLLLRDRAGRALAVARHYLVTPSEKVASELRLVSFLASHGFPTPKPLPTRDGPLFLDGGSEPSIALFPFVEGAVFDDWSGVQRATAAGTLAAMHDLCRRHGVLTGRSVDYGRILETGLLRVADTALPDKGVLLHDVERFLADELQAGLAMISLLPCGPIHHDLNPGNVIWGEDREVRALIDFDEAQDAPSVMDLISAFQYLAAGDGGLLDLSCCRDLLTGYGQRRVLSGAERQAIQFCWDLTSIIGAIEFVGDNAAYLASVMECRSFSQLYRLNRGRLMF